MKSEKPGKKFSRIEFYALAYGLFLGLAILKFGNPVILDQQIGTPTSLADAWANAWPTHWANWIFLPLAAIGGLKAFAKNLRWPETRWLWLLPLSWFGWQLISATQTVDAGLTATTLWQFLGCIAGYFIGVFLLGNRRLVTFLLVGILAAFTLCLMKAIDQRIVEFPESRQFLVTGQNADWTNVPPKMFQELKRENIVITTNGMVVANPAILAKFAKGRVNGTLVYPNALAGVVLLLFPVSIVFAFNRTTSLRPFIRTLVIGLTFFLGGLGFFWSGSKLGWLLALGLIGLYLLRLNWPARLKWSASILILVVGLGVFAVRFHHYFAAGATSVAARFDYWRAAVQTTATHPLFGTGPGTFQRPYARIKSPTAEMARLTHNDYLEQFSDSGIPGGIFYTTWIVLALIIIGRRVWRFGDAVTFAIFAGTLGWFIQGLGEFSLYIPALAWTAFTFMGCLLTLYRQIKFDKTPRTR
jgi:O-Antigen ligase